jgi:hypothetical protein
VLQRYPIEMLHGDEGRSTLLADVEDHADIGVVQRGCGLSFALKTGKRQRVASNIFGKELEGDKTVKADVFRFVNHTHPAAAGLLDDAIVGDRLADHLG